MSTCLYQINVFEIFYVFSSISYFLLLCSILMYGIQALFTHLFIMIFGVISTFGYLSKGMLNNILDLTV